jgi:hypothetical protein
MVLHPVGTYLSDKKKVDGIDWLFLFESCFLIGSFSWLLIG